MSKPLEYITPSVRMYPVQWKMLKQLALDRDVTTAELLRDVLSLYLGYAIDPRDPVYSKERMRGEIPPIIEIYPGYVKSIDLWGAKRKA